MPLQNFVARTIPTIKAAWLNQVDTLKFTIFGDAVDKPTARANLTSDLPLEINNGGTGSRGQGDAANWLLFIAGFFPVIYRYINPVTPAEVAAGVTPTDYKYLTGDVRRYGAALDGVTDDTLALRRWASVTGDLRFPVAASALVSAAIPLFTNTTITGCRGAKIVQASPNVSIFVATSQSLITVQGMKFQQTAWGADAYVAHIKFDGCNNCYALGNEFIGIQWGGIYLVASSSCAIKENYLHNSQPRISVAFAVAPVAGATTGNLTTAWTYPSGIYVIGFIQTAGGLTEGKAVTFTNGDVAASWTGGLSVNCNAAILGYTATGAADIIVFSSPTTPSSGNIIDGNYCYSNTLEVGIQIQDPYSGVLTYVNVVTNNRVNAHTGYGILCYMPDLGNSYNEITNNYVEGITGEYPLNVASGAGIYCVGNGLGGLVVANNQVKNCCIDTQTLTLTPAGIGIAGTAANTAPVVISGNVISDMSQYYGIRFNGILGGGTITGNTVNMPATQTAAGIGSGIVVANSDGVALIGNVVNNPNTTQATGGIVLFANSADNTNIIVSGNTVNGGHSSGISTSQVGGNLNKYLTIASNIVRGGDNTCVPLLLFSSTATDVNITGNNFQGGNGFVASVVGIANVRFSNNRLLGTGTVVLNTSGTCTGGFFDRSNFGVGAGATCVNAATGFNVELTKTGNTDPAAGTYAVGDVVWRSDVVTGERIFASCTVAGSPGTWKVVNLS